MGIIIDHEKGERLRNVQEVEIKNFKIEIGCKGKKHSVETSCLSFSARPKGLH